MSGTTPNEGSGQESPRDPYGAPSGDQPPAQGNQPPAYGSQPPSFSPPPGYDQSQPPPGYGYQQAAPEPSPSILTAVKLMYAGAALSVLQALLVFVRSGSIRDALEEANETTTPRLSDSQLDAAASLSIGIAVVVALIGVALWLWMAAANKKGRSWARVVSTVLGGLNILFTGYSLIGGAADAITLLMNVASIVIAAAVLWFLYRPESTQYYAAVSGVRR